MIVVRTIHPTAGESYIVNTVQPPYVISRNLIPRLSLKQYGNETTAGGCLPVGKRVVGEEVTEKGHS